MRINAAWALTRSCRSARIWASRLQPTAEFRLVARGLILSALLFVVASVPLLYGGLLAFAGEVLRPTTSPSASFAIIG